jgi:predicted outer membrane repeat protein
MPDDVSNLTDTGGGAINFQTSISLEDAIVFYRAEFSEAGYVERDINTAITETTFSMVFDGHASGEAIVIQGVDLGDGSTNISIRFEDV